MCPPKYRVVRFAMNNIQPSSLKGHDMIFSNRFGNTTVPYLKKQITHSMGWMTILLAQEDYTMEFINGEHITNRSMDATFFGFSVSALNRGA